MKTYTDTFTHRSRRKFAKESPYDSSGNGTGVSKNLGIVIDEGADRYAYQQGLFVIGQSGETVRILNDDQFRPKEW